MKMYFCENCKTVYQHDVCCPFCDFNNDKNEVVERVIIDKGEK
jgi:RNA polymerase subunit RPABC4/transcription elongation factor Spt4